MIHSVILLSFAIASFKCNKMTTQTHWDAPRCSKNAITVTTPAHAQNPYNRSCVAFATPLTSGPWKRSITFTASDTSRIDLLPTVPITTIISMYNAIKTNTHTTIIPKNIRYYSISDTHHIWVSGIEIHHLNTPHTPPNPHTDPNGVLHLPTIVPLLLQPPPPMHARLPRAMHPPMAHLRLHMSALSAGGRPSAPSTTRARPRP